jgi:hypothetical protein
LHCRARYPRGRLARCSIQPARSLGALRALANTSCSPTLGKRFRPRTLIQIVALHLLQVLAGKLPGPWSTP